MRITVDRRWRVDAAHRFVLPLRHGLVWGQMRDFERFITRDPLHTRVIGYTRTPRSGAPMIIRHGMLGVGPSRRSRILRWSEGRGYAFSDLSRRGNDVGFPHACVYELEPLGPDASALTIAARGRWTATWVPRWMVRCWLAWVLTATADRVMREMRAYRRFLETQGIALRDG